MPTYEYLCTVCNHEFECEQSIKDDPLEECPKCMVAGLKRVINNQSGFILKGGGWYSDLYSSTKPAKKKKG
jgi:putative FmdB family regulatory protein